MHVTKGNAIWPTRQSQHIQKLFSRWCCVVVWLVFTFRSHSIPFNVNGKLQKWSTANTEAVLTYKCHFQIYWPYFLLAALGNEFDDLIDVIKHFSVTIETVHCSHNLCTGDIYWCCPKKFNLKQIKWYTRFHGSTYIIAQHAGLNNM